MQEALLPPAHPDRFYSAFGSKQLGGLGDRRLSSPNLLTNGDDLFYGSYALFSPSRSLFSPSPRVASLSHCSSSSDSVVDNGDDADPAVATEHRLHLARLALQYQEVANRFELCLSHLADAADEAAALRRENAELRVANNNLACRISKYGGRKSCALALAGDLRPLLPEEQTVSALPPPPPLAAQIRPGAIPEKQFALPKSISIRSTGYEKLNQGGKHRVSKPVNVGSQRVFVGIDGAGGGEHKGTVKNGRPIGGLEFEVYNQGMLKTELCNKWEETGACPTATSASSRTASRSFVPSSAIPATRPRSAAWCSPGVSAHTATAAISATPSPPLTADRLLFRT
ncbi:hypothetical protein GUJ93_ZPchr0005g15449 [Zizania palustris]|uniref:Uncharacterized protein n=1 Tax=Zizania palustris TaxID=103762 RepID=A0A8J5SQM8_ZIZPA|nr:hypothetical protein GUJ93_ZPchr0005g15449 [Zizania palustris]